MSDDNENQTTPSKSKIKLFIEKIKESIDDNITSIVISKIEGHNEDSNAHSDIIPTKTSDIENDSDFITSSDLTGYLKDTDVKDNLISTDTDKPLSANQGRLLKSMNEKPMVLKVTGNSFEEYNDSTALQGNNIVVDYGDGTIEPLGTRLQHSYTDEINNHTVKIYGVTSLGESCFKRCSSLTSIIIPNNVTSLGESCFEQSKGLTSITIPNSVTSLEDFCFKNCEGLPSITIPNSVTRLGNNCFQNCEGLTSITLHDILLLGDYCFSSCTSLTSITLPNVVVSDTAFYNCTSLTDYYLNWINPPITWSNDMMPNNTNTIFHIPYGTTANYVTKGFPSDKLQEYIKTSEQTTDSITDNDLRPVTSNAVNDALSTLSNQVSNLSNLKAVKVVQDKGTASADTMGYLYITPNGTSADAYYTKEDNNSYTWVRLDQNILDEVKITWAGIRGNPFNAYTPSDFATPTDISNHNSNSSAHNDIRTALNGKASTAQLNNYVTKDGNKVLSSNDFNDEYKNIVDNLLPSKVFLDTDIGIAIIDYDRDYNENIVYLLNGNLNYDINNDVITNANGYRYVTTYDLNTKASTATATSTANGLMSSTDKSKLDDMTTVALEVTYADGSPSETLYIVKRSGGS